MQAVCKGVALGAAQVQAFHNGFVFDGRAAGVVAFAVALKGGLAGLCQRHGVALPVYVQFGPVHFIKQHAPGGHFGQVGGCAGRDDKQAAADVFLGFQRVDAIARARCGHALGHFGHGGNVFGNAGAGTFGQFSGGQDPQEVCRALVNAGHEPVEAGLGLEHLAGPHEHHALARVVVAQGLHYRASVRGAAGAKFAVLVRAGVFGDDLVSVRPHVHGQVWIGFQSCGLNVERFDSHSVFPIDAFNGLFSISILMVVRSCCA